MLIEMRYGEWINLQDVKSVKIIRAKVLGEEKSKWHVVVASQCVYADSKLFDSLEEAYAFAADIVDKLNYGDSEETWL